MGGVFEVQKSVLDLVGTLLVWSRIGLNWSNHDVVIIRRMDV